MAQPLHVICAEAGAGIRQTLPVSIKTQTSRLNIRTFRRYVDHERRRRVALVIICRSRATWDVPRQRYISALGHRWLNRLYDPLLRWTMPEFRFKTRLLELARIGGGHHVLDLGCRTGTLMLLVQEHAPSARVHGVDGDMGSFESRNRRRDARSMV